jgi:hypothetical protein
MFKGTLKKLKILKEKMIMKNNMEYKNIFALTREDIKAMGYEERNAIHEYCEWHMEANDDFSNYYLVYALVGAIEQEEYLARNEDKIKAYFNRHFKGKTWEEISSNEELCDCWDFYSDWHKDCYGYRPHGIVCGEYIRPY